MKHVLASGIAFLLIFAGIRVQAFEPLVLYDNFNAKPINPDKWIGSSGGGIEVIREIQDNRLRLLSRNYGRTDSDTGSTLANPGLSFLNPALVTAMAATLRVTKVRATGCPTSGSEVTDVPALLIGNFFNNVHVQIRVARRSDSTEPPHVLRTLALAYECTNPDCSGTFFGIEDLGPVDLNQKVRLRLQWDPDNDRFIFQRDDEPEVFISYSVQDTAPPIDGGFKILQVGPGVPNCTATPRPVGFIEAFFDDVFVNASAVP